LLLLARGWAALAETLHSLFVARCVAVVVVVVVCVVVIVVFSRSLSVIVWRRGGVRTTGDEVLLAHGRGDLCFVGELVEALSQPPRG
jgi:hypothetical protein